MRVCIIIPMRNEEAFVGGCLDSVLAQVEGREDIEIFCVDGASEDRTPDIVREYADRDPRVKLVDNLDKIVPRAMNLAIGRACGEFIIRLDCHCNYALDYIDKCLEVLERTGADNVGGYVTTLPGSDSLVGRSIAVACSSRFGVGGSVFRTGGGEQEVDTVPFGCFRRDVFDRFGMYDERLVRNQDIELNSRIRKGGGRIVISPEIKLTYFNRSSFSGLRQQAFYNGLWNPYTIWIVGGGLRIRHFVPLAFVTSVLLLGCLGFLWQPAWVLLGCGIGVYVVAGSAMAAKAAQGTSASAFLVFLAFIQLHLAYGVGSLWGVFTAPLRFGLKPAPRRGQIGSGA